MTTIDTEPTNDTDPTGDADATTDPGPTTDAEPARDRPAVPDAPHPNRLRRKLGEPPLIRTLRGTGIQLRA